MSEEFQARAYRGCGLGSLGPSVMVRTLHMQGLFYSKIPSMVQILKESRVSSLYQGTGRAKT